MLRWCIYTYHTEYVLEDFLKSYIFRKLFRIAYSGGISKIPMKKYLRIARQPEKAPALNASCVIERFSQTALALFIFGTIFTFDTVFIFCTIGSTLRCRPVRGAGWVPYPSHATRGSPQMPGLFPLLHGGRILRAPLPRVRCGACRPRTAA